MDPEIVFVANLTNADAPALKVSFQCDFSLTSGKIAQRMTAQVKGFKVLACAFLKEKQDKSVTTVRKLVFRNEKSNENCWQACPLVGISIALRKSSFHIEWASVVCRLKENLLSVGARLHHIELCLKPV